MRETEKEMGKSTSDYSTELITRDNSCKGLGTAARADVKTSLSCLSC